MLRQVHAIGVVVAHAHVVSLKTTSPDGLGYQLDQTIRRIEFQIDSYVQTIILLLNLLVFYN